MTVATAPETREIVVQRCEIIRQGIGRNRRPYTLFRLHAVDTSLSANPLPGELRSFQSFDSGTYKVTLEEYEPGIFTVHKERDASDVRKRRSAARASLTGQVKESSARPAEQPCEPFQQSRIDALEQRVGELEQRLELALSLFAPPDERKP